MSGNVRLPVVEPPGLPMSATALNLFRSCRAATLAPGIGMARVHVGDATLEGHRRRILPGA